MLALRAQTGPVFLTYRASAAVDAIERRVTADEPLFDFEAPDGVRHSVWRTSREDAAALVTAFQAIPALYIADGHHRAASASRTRAEMKARKVPPTSLGDGADANTFLAVAFPHNQMQVLPYNRTVKDLNGQSPDQFLDRVGRVAAVSDGAATPARKGDVRMYLAGRWYALDFTGVRPQDESRASSLDVALLQAKYGAAPALSYS